MFPPKRNRELIFLSSRKLINSGLENGASSLTVNAKPNQLGSLLVSFIGKTKNCSRCLSPS